MKYIYFTLICSAYYFMKLSFFFFSPPTPFMKNLEDCNAAVNGNFAFCLAF